MSKIHKEMLKQREDIESDTISSLNNIDKEETLYNNQAQNEKVQNEKVQNEKVQNEETVGLDSSDCMSSNETSDNDDDDNGDNDDNDETMSEDSKGLDDDLTNKELRILRAIIYRQMEPMIPPPITFMVSLLFVLHILKLLFIVCDGMCESKCNN